MIDKKDKREEKRRTIQTIPLLSFKDKINVHILCTIIINRANVLSSLKGTTHLIQTGQESIPVENPRTNSYGKTKIPFLQNEDST